MKRRVIILNSKGFTAGLLVPAIAVVVLAGGLGYVYFHHKPAHHPSIAVSAQPGTTDHITDSIIQGLNTETTDSSAGDAAVNQAVSSDTSSATNVGSAYNENNY